MSTSQPKYAYKLLVETPVGSATKTVPADRHA